MTSSHRTPAIGTGSPDRPVDPAQDTTGGIAAQSTVRGRWAAAATLVAAAVIDLAVPRLLSQRA